MFMEQGLIDIRNKAREMADTMELGEAMPYGISCGTLIAILDELENKSAALAAIEKHDDVAVYALNLINNAETMEHVRRILDTAFACLERDKAKER